MNKKLLEMSEGREESERRTSRVVRESRGVKVRAWEENLEKGSVS